MKLEITKSMFRDQFIKWDRKENFSYEALGALYDYLEEIFEGNYSLDIIELCCTYTEEKIEDACKNYDVETLEDLENVIWHDEKNVLYMSY